jgi:hypothetical protein
MGEVIAGEAPVLAVVDALRIESSDAYLWFGARFTVRSGERLVHAVQRRLYADFYCTGGAAPHAGPEDPIPSVHAPGFVTRLSRANAGRGAWRPGWRLVGEEDGLPIVEGEGLRVWAEWSDVRRSATRPLVSVWRPKERFGLTPGFYLALGDAGEPHDGGRARFYFNVTSRAACSLVRILTTRLNAASLPFQLKLLNDPRAFSRCDAGVLYVADRDREAVEAHVGEVEAALGPELMPSVPALTLALAPGIGFAEDPGDGESFGANRCRLISEAMVRAHELGATSRRRLLALVLERFARVGIDVARPHLGPPRLTAHPS